MNPKSRTPFSIRVFVAEGMPSGFRRVTNSNWTGEMLLCPRERYRAVSDDECFSESGIYILTEPRVRSRTSVYVGQARRLRDSLDRRFAKRPTYRRVIAFIRRHTPLNPVETSYLQARVLKIVQEGGRVHIDNARHPQPPGISALDIAEMDGFLDHMRSILDALDIDVIRGSSTPSPPVDIPYRQGCSDSSDRDTGNAQSGPKSAGIFALNASGITARGKPTLKGFRVFEGSYVSGLETVSLPKHCRDLRRQLVRDSVLTPDGLQRYRFARDFDFGSPSAAASVCLGRSSNGRQEWKDDKGVSLREHQ